LPTRNGFISKHPPHNSITPQLFKQKYATLVQQQFLLIEGKLQNQEGVIPIKAERVQPLTITQAETSSHDFH
jgi:error-prone DNA polymerase